MKITVFNANGMNGRPGVLARRLGLRALKERERPSNGGCAKKLRRPTTPMIIEPGARDLRGTRVR